MKCKKIISLVMLLAIMSALLSIDVFAEDFEYESKCGENVRY